ncbi:DNA-deoxyinosine glycosylase [Flavobacterium sp. J372]|uniref:DNA-deoxyinosine glycosylase n=1 Tax=Flavobacterium sp. J372 TaxID=2898436 RepID=UPI002151F23F|nr:DNA-deoxyinosine glycosylase [Flavobacterium sp. J372]MCR5862240.1 DNA-deoxyinosine glycosylase [Flavobacterium sp. J372]
MKQAFKPVADNDSKIIILGTMPGEKSLELQQYYGNRGNHFWKIIFEVLGESFSADYAERINLLHKYKIALWDVLKYCEREGSLDSNIKNEVPNDFEAFYAMHPQIKHVFFSSKNAAAYYDRYVGRRDGIIYDVLPSPSGANASMRFQEKLVVWREKILPLVDSSGKKSLNP